MKVTFVYANPRTERLAAIARGELPDTSLWGQNHLGSLGLDADVHVPALRRRERRAGLLHRLTWYLREVPLAWEVGSADAVVTSLGPVFPLVAGLRGRPRVVLLNFSFSTLLERSTGPRRRLVVRALRSADAIVCIATAHRERLLGQAAFDPARVHVAPLGTDADFWAPLPPADDGIVLTVGRDLGRDYRTLLDAVDGLDARVVVATKPEQLQGLRIPANVETRFDIAPDEVKRLYAQAACVVNPIRAEGNRFGSEGSGIGALLEANACARPVVQSDRAYCSDYVERDRTALVVPPQDPAAMRAAIERVLGDRQEAAALARAGRARVEERHTTPAFAARLAAILQGLRPPG